MTYTPEQQSLRQLCLAGNYELVVELEKGQKTGIFKALEREFFSLLWVMELEGKGLQQLFNDHELRIHTNTSILPRCIGQLQHITDLYLCENLLTDKEVEFIGNKMPNIEYLDCSNNLFTCVPNSLKKLENLKNLAISGNRIRKLPDWLKDSKIEQLEFNMCGFTKFPTKVFGMQHLTILELSDNEIQSLPPEINTIPNLDTLDLSSNNLSSLPKELSDLKNLRYLNINNNYFKTIPDVLYKIPSLTHINLGGNSLSYESYNDVINKFFHLGVRVLEN